MSFGQGYWNERNTSLYINNRRSVWLSERWWGRGEPGPSSLTWAELPSRVWPVTALEAVPRRVRSSLASLLEHMQKICQEYRFIMIPRKTEVRPTACRAARYGGKHQVNQTFIMYAGSWRAGINFIFTAPYFANGKKKKKKRGNRPVGGLGWCHSLLHSLMSLAKINYISFNWSHRAHCFLTCTHRHPAFLTVNMCRTVRWDTVARLYDIHSQADILVQQHILKCSPSAGSQLWMPTLNNTTCHTV